VEYTPVNTSKVDGFVPHTQHDNLKRIPNPNLEWPNGVGAIRGGNQEVATAWPCRRKGLSLINVQGTRQILLEFVSLEPYRDVRCTETGEAR
jgi:hypothetical protein